MIQPYEMSMGLPMTVARGVVSTTTKVWGILTATKNGNLAAVQQLVDECPELIYAQYNYTPPIHFAVREGHTKLVKYLLDKGAHDSTYRIYPFLDNLQTIADDRGYNEIVELLNQYAADPSLQKYKGDNGKIHFQRSAKQQEFEDAVHTNNLDKTALMLKENPEFALDETYFWGEGVLTKPIQHQEFELADLLVRYGARIPGILKWIQAYYFKFYDSAVYSMEHGMSPNAMSWQHVTILHDMAQKGNIEKAALLLKHGAEINPVDEDYQSTPLGMAARWGHLEMVEFLLKNGADVNKAGADWATPLIWAKKKGYRDIERVLVDDGAK